MIANHVRAISAAGLIAMGGLAVAAFPATAQEVDPNAPSITLEYGDQNFEQAPMPAPAAPHQEYTTPEYVGPPAGGGMQFETEDGTPFDMSGVAPGGPDQIGYADPEQLRGVPLQPAPANPNPPQVMTQAEMDAALAETEKRNKEFGDLVLKVLIGGFVVFVLMIVLIVRSARKRRARRLAKRELAQAEASALEGSVR